MDETGPYSMLKLYFHPTTMKLEGLLLKHKEGIHYTLAIKSAQTVNTLDENSFRFIREKYPNTEIIELMD